MKLTASMTLPPVSSTSPPRANAPSPTWVDAPEQTERLLACGNVLEVCEETLGKVGVANRGRSCIKGCSQARRPPRTPSKPPRVLALHGRDVALPVDVPQVVATGQIRIARRRVVGSRGVDRARSADRVDGNHRIEPHAVGQKYSESWNFATTTASSAAPASAATSSPVASAGAGAARRPASTTR